jgi:exonuclease VII small subunit
MTRITRIWIIALGMVFGLGGSSLLAQAQERCEHRIHEARERLQYAIQQYGEDSHQAREAHEQLEEARRSCNGDYDNRAGREERCEHRIHEARERLEYAIQQYGEGSPQAREAHERLEDARRSCGGGDDDDRR